MLCLQETHGKLNNKNLLVNNKLGKEFVSLAKVKKKCSNVYKRKTEA